MNLEGAGALVTGGSSGIGAATVAALAKAGARVAVLDRAAADGQGDVALPCDITDERQVEEAVRRVHDEFGGLDVAVLNAGIGGLAHIVDMTLEEFDRVMDVNLKGTFLTLRESARAMVEGGNGGVIVATSSTSSYLAERGMAHYNASKAAVNQLVRIAARELGPAGIRVNAVAPGVTQTPLFAPTEHLPGYWDRLAERTPSGVIGTAEDVAEAILAMARLDWVTGQVLTADGGISLFSPIDPIS
ncbi:MAG TPA: SDR family oxidoreductase [Acidimicrobiales bacterium]|nr:SDR family oxidoreductase [Acidimicrobiales bacterium]